MTNGRYYSAHPPRAASWLLDLFVPRDQITPVLGDLLEEFSAEAARVGVSSARRWYWRQSAKSILHLLDAQLRPAPWRSLASVIAGLLLLWIANMPLVGIPRLVFSGDWPEPLRLAWLAFVPTVPTANPIWGRRRPAHDTCCQSDVRAIFSSNNREAEEVHAADCEQRCLVVSGSENWNTFPGVGIAARTATFRLRGARSGDEVRQLAVWQRRLRVPAAARAGVPVCPWPVRGASWIRDNTPGRTSRAGKGKPR
jgi:hypothetical protein